MDGWELSLLNLNFNLALGWVQSLLPTIHIISLRETTKIYGKFKYFLKILHGMKFSVPEIYLKRFSRVYCVVTMITIYFIALFSCTQASRTQNVYWTCISKFNRGLLRYVLNSRTTFCLHKANYHSSELQDVFAQMCCKFGIYVRISWILIFLQAKFRLF
jgi:hypothetical protein